MAKNGTGVSSSTRTDPRAQLGDQMEVLLILVDLHELNDVGVITLLQYFHLTFEDVVLSHLGFPDGFDGVPDFGLAVHALLHHPKKAVSDFFGVDAILDADIG